MAYHKPYDEPGLNNFYNLLFADDRALISEESKRQPPFSLLFDASPDLAALQQIADDPQQESRLRAFAYQRMREHGIGMRSQALLGVVVEVPQEKGLDTFAAYADGQVRYINQMGSPVLMEDRVQVVGPRVDMLMQAALRLVAIIPPFHGTRIAPPAAGEIRITFLASNGIHVAQGTADQVAKDAMASEVMGAALALLEQIVELAGAEPTER